MLSTRRAKEVDCTLVLIGNNASDDPEGEVIFETIKSSVDESVVVLAVDDRQGVVTDGAVGG